LGGTAHLHIRNLSLTLLVTLQSSKTLPQVSPARKETYHSWDKLWTLNRRLLDPTSARHMAVNDTGRVLLTVSAAQCCGLYLLHAKPSLVIGS
jgi:hypothetical protein